MNVLSPAAAGRDVDRRESLCRDMLVEAGRLALQGFEAAGSGVRSMKGRQDFLTETDGAVESYLRSRIAKAFPEDGFLGEETGGTVEPNLWVVDPIDGTANFARGIPHFCISVAFLCEGVTELGAICNPAPANCILQEAGAARRGRHADPGRADHRLSAGLRGTWLVDARPRPPDYLAALARLLGLGVN